MGFDPQPALETLRGFQRRTVEHVFDRLYRAPHPADRFLVADETGLGKSMVARGVIAKAIAELDLPDSGVDRIDVVYVCSNADLARQNLARLNVTGQADIIESGRLTLLPGQLDVLQGPLAKGMNKRVNFISLTPGTSFKVTRSTGRARERAVIFALLEQLHVITDANRDHALQLLRATAGTGSFEWQLRQVANQNPDGFVPVVVEEFRKLAAESGNLETLKLELSIESPNWELQRKNMNAVIGGLRADLAKAGLNCLEPDLIILDEFQRFRDLLRPPVVDGELNEANELARQFLEYDGAKLLLLSATPYKAHTSAGDSEGDDHSKDFLQLLEFLSRGEEGYLDQLTLDFETRRRELMGQATESQATERIEQSLLRFMSRTERPQLGQDDMLEVIPMEPTEIRPVDLRSYRSLSAVSRATGSGKIMEYWKSIPYFAHFLSGYKIGREAARDADALQPQLASLTTIEPQTFRAYGPLETDNSKYRAVRDHTVGQDWWKLLWIPPSLPYLEPAGPYAEINEDVTKQLVFTSWDAAPTALTTLLSYDAERQILEGSEHGENSPDARKKFHGPFRYAVSNGNPDRMSTLALFVPHVALSEAADPLTIARTAGRPVQGSELKEHTSNRGRDIAGPVSNDSGRLGAWVSYFSFPGALPADWTGRPGLALAGFREAALVADQERNDDGAQDDVNVGQQDDSAYLQHVERMLETAAGGFTGWDENAADLAANSPANCMYRALLRIVPDRMPKDAVFRAALVGVAGLRTLFNRLDVTELLKKLYPGGESWQRVLRYCEGGNLQAVLDEHVFQLRSQQPPGELTPEQLMYLAQDVRGALSLRPAPLNAKYPDGSHEDLRMGVRFAVRYSNSRSEDGESARMPEVRRSFNSPFWPFVLASTSVGQEGIDFHWWSHSVMHWNVPSNPVDFEQREGRVHRYLGHAVRKNVARKHGDAVFSATDQDPWTSLFEVAIASVAAGSEGPAKEFSPHWIHPGESKIERRLLDHPLSRDLNRTKQMLSGLATYRLALGQARQDDLMELIREDTEVRPLNLQPRPAPGTSGRRQ